MHGAEILSRPSRRHTMNAPSIGGTVVAPRSFMQSQVIARVDLPGITHADVSLQVHQTRLLITAGPEGAAQLLKHLEGDGHVLYRRDRGTGGFFRSMLLPDGIHVDEIKATLVDGVLLVTAPGDVAGDAAEGGIND
jgi:HSP20 family molecular chaperone IbpA